MNETLHFCSFGWRESGQPPAPIGDRVDRAKAAACAGTAQTRVFRRDIFAAGLVFDRWSPSGVLSGLLGPAFRLLCDPCVLFCGNSSAADAGERRGEIAIYGKMMTGTKIKPLPCDSSSYRVIFWPTQNQTAICTPARTNTRRAVAVEQPTMLELSFSSGKTEDLNRWRDL